VVLGDYNKCQQRIISPNYLKLKADIEVISKNEEKQRERRFKYEI
jgi:hypothetical protein